MKIYQSRSFEKRIKRMHIREKEILDQEIRNIAENPSIGEEKKGDLREILIHKFKIKTAEYLLAYRMVGEDLELIMIGPHENYYRDLKKYLKNQ
jgi:mRNA-degrading endonuclease RelE of RelBE toxin-antitoxin system